MSFLGLSLGLCESHCICRRCIVVWCRMWIPLMKTWIALWHLKLLIAAVMFKAHVSLWPIIESHFVVLCSMLGLVIPKVVHKRLCCESVVLMQVTNPGYVVWERMSVKSNISSNLKCAVITTMVLPLLALSISYEFGLKWTSGNWKSHLQSCLSLRWQEVVQNTSRVDAVSEFQKDN